MRFHQIGRAFLFQRSQPFAQWLFAAITLIVLAGASLAQGPPPNITFNDSSGARYKSGGRGVAFQGDLLGNVHGLIKNGELLNLTVRLDPYVNGPNGFRLFQISYRKGNATLQPTLRWYDNGVTKKLVIRGVRASEHFSGTAIASIGSATVEITFINGGPGRLLVKYRHTVYSGTPKNPLMRFNGTVCDATPLAGHRLYFDLVK